MASGPLAYRDSFVVRIWHESRGSTWKGWAQHTGSREAILFQSLGELLGFLEQWTQTEDKQPVRAGLR
jgi:hypothetical protein